MSDELFSIDRSAVSDLAKILKESDLTEIEYQKGEARIRVVRNVASQGVTYIEPMTAQPTKTVQQNVPGDTAVDTLSPQGKDILCPMVGTIYIAPEPGAKPFVQVGDTVTEGQTLFIVEAMKVMNPIKSSFAGTVSVIYAKDATPVEFGERLLFLEVKEN